MRSRSTAPGLAPTSLRLVRSRASFFNHGVRRMTLGSLTLWNWVLRIEDDRLSQQRLEIDLVYLVSLTDVYRPPLVPVEASVEEIAGIRDLD